MKIYRVYQSYHESSKSGTYEYGYYANHGKAIDRAETVARSQFPRCVRGVDVKIVHHGIGTVEASAPGMWESIWVYVEEIELDRDINRNNCGYT